VSVCALKSCIVQAPAQMEKERLWQFTLDLMRGKNRGIVYCFCCGVKGKRVVFMLLLVV